MDKVSRRQFVATTAASVVVSSALLSAEDAEAADKKAKVAEAKADPLEKQAIGPMVGHVDPTTAILWYRAAKPGKYAALVEWTDSPSTDKPKPIRVVAEASDDSDRCMKFKFNDLVPGGDYRYKIVRGDETVVDDVACSFRTPTLDDAAAKVCLAFGSCARNEPNALWSQIGKEGAEGVVLLGDTPYIDSDDLAVCRSKHRNFLAIPELAALAKNTAIWGTWDDHDFYNNNSDGRAPNKIRNRQALIEYRANPSYGHDNEGIYTRFRRGPMEVFLLDTRWFSQTEKSPVDPSKPTLLGKAQWNWLLKGLEESKAPFKVIACGMIWDDKENKESDDWGTYVHERSALFDFIGKKNIAGVVLIGGDIHCSRHLKYKTETQAGYALHQFIVSPIHNKVIPELNVKHPDLIRGEPVPHVWLRLEADSTKTPATLDARWVQRDGQKMWDCKLTVDDLKKA